jgi:hypothetical protein
MNHPVKNSGARSKTKVYERLLEVPCNLTKPWAQPPSARRNMPRGGFVRDCDLLQIGEKRINESNFPERALLPYDDVVIMKSVPLKHRQY